MTKEPVVVEGAVCEADERVRKFDPFLNTLGFLNDVFPHPVVLAGGCIRDFWIDGESKIRDYDAFVLGVTESEVKHLDEVFAVRYREDFLSEEVVEQSMVPWHYANSQSQVFHIPRTNVIFPWIPGKKTTQIMYTQATTMQELVNRFDWRACSFGFDGETVITDGVHDFWKQCLSLNPENALRSARNTLRRGFNLEDKYRGTAHFLKLPNELILALASMLVLNGEGQNPQKA